MTRVLISKSNRNEKRLQAEFFFKDGRKKTVHFGSKDGSAFPDHKNEQTKDAWIARHKVRGNFNDPFTPSALARWILWNKPTIKSSIEDYKRKFNFT